jgi:hypothetical protein
LADEGKAAAPGGLLFLQKREAAGILTPQRGRRKSPAMMTVEQIMFFRRRAVQVPARDRM